MRQLLLAAFLITFSLTLIGCTASWRAPVESRGGHPVVTKPAAKPRSAIPSAIRPRAVQGAEYRVRRGDTLFGIAWQNGVDFRQMARWNGIRAPYRIYPGQTLRMVPPPATRRPPPVVSRKEKPVVRKPSVKPSREPATAARKLVWRWPANGRITATFHPTDPLRKGLKIAGNSGSDIVAAERGRVVYSGSGLIGYGRLIIVKHNDKYLSAYGHNRKILVKEGDQVTKGQKIAEMGNANNGKPLLHFEIRRDGKPVDPQRLLPRR